MADEDVLVSASAPEETTIPQLSDLDKKRKLGDLESDAPEPLAGDDSSLNLDGETEAPNADLEEKVDDESELKRPRLEDNVEQASENGHKGENIENSLEDGVKGENIENSLEDGEGLEQIPESSLLLAEQHQNDDVLELVSAQDDKPKAESADDEKEESKVEAEEPSAMGDDTNSTSKKMDVPNNKVGVLIGKAGDTIRFLQYNSGAKIQITRDADADPRAPTRPVELIGTLESILKAERLINDVIAEADAGGSPSLVARGFSTVQSVVGDQVEIQVPNEKVGLIIGKGGETIKSLQTKSGARIQLVPQHLPAGDQSKERTVRVTGDRRSIEMAKELIKEVMIQPVRPSPLSAAGYHQPPFRPSGPAAPQWPNRDHPGPYGGFDYHRGPSQHSQYSAPQYGNYPQQAPRSNFGHSWEQRPPTMHAPPQVNYNYGQPQGPDYGQPAPYSQGPTPNYGQGYSEMQPQHGYVGHGMPQSTGGYGPPDHYGRQGSYGVPQQGPHGQAYGQQQRAHQPGEMPYATGPPPNQAYGSSVPQQSYGYTQQSYPPYGAGPGYPQPTGQPVSSYGQPAGQQPSAYPTPVGGYTSYPSQPGYGEQAVAANTGYGYQAPAEAAYPTYGAPTTAQQGYAQPGYDQTNAQAGAYGAAAATTPAPAAAPVPAVASTPAATTGYVKSVSPQPVYPQYDASQVYAAPR